MPSREELEAERARKRAEKDARRAERRAAASGGEDRAMEKHVA